MSHAQRSNRGNPNHPSYMANANDPNQGHNPNPNSNPTGMQTGNPYNPTINVNYGGVSKGGGKQKWKGNNWNNNKNWNTLNRNTPAVDPRRWCRHCEKHYKDLKVPCKDHVCASHWDKDCKFNKKKLAEKAAKGKGKGKNNVIKNDKKKKGGKGKGKKGKKGGKKNEA